ncbi:hypothetical protein U1839_24535 [Sphingomonas sp. RT2P30]|uniref:hypothetical protein n=1 Tax=Parasphingomonas halimpatiens TaxID=3096162 RepID=UPI002FC62F09
MAHAIEVEIERNFAAFKDMLGNLLPQNAGRYALLHDQELKGLYTTPGDAERAGYAQFKEAPYSVQLVTDEPIDLGFYSYALSQG